MAKKIPPISAAPKSPMKKGNFEIRYKKDTHLSNIYSNKHNHYELYFLVSGKVSYTIEGVVHHLRPGDLLLISPGQEHYALIETGDISYERYVLWITEDYINSLSSKETDLSIAFNATGFLGSCIHPSPDMQIILTSLMQNILVQSNSNEFGADLLIDFYIAQILIHIIRIKLYQNNFYNEKDFAGNTLIFETLTYIAEHIDQPITINHIAGNLFVSRSHLSNKFTQFMGITIHQYITKKKLYLAKQDILQGASIETICTDYCFGNYSSFYRAFKHEFGMSPREYFKKFTN